MRTISDAASEPALASPTTSDAASVPFFASPTLAATASEPRLATPTASDAASEPPGASPTASDAAQVTLRHAEPAVTTATGRLSSAPDGRIERARRAASA